VTLPQKPWPNSYRTPSALPASAKLRNISSNAALDAAHAP
jgi:hypothetical protein